MNLRLSLTRAALVAAAAIPVLLTACEGMKNPLAPNPDNAMPDEHDFVRSKPLYVPEFQFVWERTKFMLQTDGFGIDGSRTDRAKREIVSQWKTILAPARYQGKRRRVIVRFEEAGEGRWIASTAVMVQRNEDIQGPTEIARAVWKADTSDMTRAEVLTYNLETGFAPPKDTDAKR